jgi:hypothetical protein
VVGENKSMKYVIYGQFKSGYANDYLVQTTIFPFDTIKQAEDYMAKCDYARIAKDMGVRYYIREWGSENGNG